MSSRAGQFVKRVDEGLGADALPWVHVPLSEHGDPSDALVPCCDTDALPEGIIVIGSGSDKYLGRSRSISVGVCTERLSDSLCVRLSFSAAARSRSRESAASSNCFCVAMVASRDLIPGLACVLSQ